MLKVIFPATHTVHRSCIHWTLGNKLAAAAPTKKAACTCHGLKSAQCHQIYAGPFPKVLGASSCPTIKAAQHPYAPAAPK